MVMRSQKDKLEEEKRGRIRKGGRKEEGYTFISILRDDRKVVITEKMHNGLTKGKICL